MAIRYAETSQIRISDDISTDPKFIRFDETVTDTDIVNLSLLEELTMQIAANTSSGVNLPAASCKWLYIKPSGDVSVTINGGSPIILKGGKAAKLWLTLTALSILNNSATAAINVTLAIGA